MEKSKGDLTAQKKSGLEIIFEFKDTLNRLIHFYSLYINLLAELKIIASDTEKIEKLDEEQKNTIKQYGQELRYHSTVAYIKFNSLKQVLKDSPPLKLQEQYKKIKESFIIDDEDCLKYINTLDSFFMSNIIQELLKTNQDLLNEIYPNA